MHYPTELLWCLHVHLDSESGRAKQDYRQVAYKKLVEKVMAYFAPRRSRIASRFKFSSRSQQPGESIATYVSA